MLKTLLSSGLISGAIAGLVVAILQFWLTQPLIVEAERYETGELILSIAAAPQSAIAAVVSETSVASDGTHTAMGSGLDVWRNLQTVLFTVLTWSAFGLLAAAALAAVALLNPAMVPSGLAVAVIGFATFCLAPALGLPPELPGMPAADLEARQIWWIFVVAATAVSAGLLVLWRTPMAILAAVSLILLPHLMGAPFLEQAGSAVVPPELSAQFSARVIGVIFVGWIVLGIAIARLSVSGEGLHNSYAYRAGLPQDQSRKF